MKINISLSRHLRMLPYNGSNLEFIAKNLKVPLKRVFDILSVIDLSSEELVSFLVLERLKNRERRSEIYTDKLYR